MSTTAFEDIIKETNKAIDEAKEKAKNAFMAEVKDVFRRHPEIKMFHWCQYTPYFNDGDACEFSVHDIYFSNYDINAWGEYDDEDEEGEPADFFSHYLGWGAGATGQFADLAALGNFMRSGTGEEILAFMFGDHVEVILTKDGATVEDYNHD